MANFFTDLLSATIPGQAYQRVKQQSALRDLASQMGGVPTDGSYGPVQPIDQKTALQKYAAITGDFSPMFGIGQNTPADVKSFQFFSALPEEQRQQFLNLKRSSQLVDRGGSIDVLNPMNPMSALASYSKTPPPQELPEFKNAQENAVQQALNEWAKTIAANKAAGQVEGAETKKKEFAYPESAATIDESVKIVDEALAAPGFDRNFGKMGLIPNIPGSEASDAASYIVQIKGAAFLTAVQKLRGSGQITEKEGDAATQAVGRFQKAQSAKSARKALDDYKQILLAAKQRAAQGTKYDQGDQQYPETGIFDGVSPKKPPNLPSGQWGPIRKVKSIKKSVK